MDGDGLEVLRGLDGDGGGVDPLRVGSVLLLRLGRSLRRHLVRALSERIGLAPDGAGGCKEGRDGGFERWVLSMKIV